MSINISEVIWTILCFFVLLFVLKKLLFDPLLRVMDERQARIDAGETARQDAEARLRENEAAIEASRQTRGEEAKTLLAEGRADDKARCGERIAAAHAAAREAAQTAQEKVKTEQEEVLSQAEQEMPKWVDLLSDRILDSAAQKQ